MLERLEIKSQAQDGRQTSECSLCVAFCVMVLRKLIEGLAFSNQRCSKHSQACDHRTEALGNTHRRHSECTLLGQMQHECDQGWGSWKLECIGDE